MHAVLEKLFREFLPINGQTTRYITPKDLDKMKVLIPNLVGKEFSIHFNDDPASWQTGNNHVHGKVGICLL